VTASTIAIVFPVGASTSPALPDQLPQIARASTLDKSADDFVAVRDVCTRCHVASQFLNAPRSASRWEQTYARMVQNGARATPEQVDRIVVYFQRNFTIININTSPVDELGPTLQVSEDTVREIIERRAIKKFTSLAELARFPGVDASKLKQLAARNLVLF
jgi:hypothetical protein